MRYLSDQWFAAANDALAGLTPLSTDVVVGYRVSGGPDGGRAYAVRLGPDEVAVTPGGTENAGVVFILDWELAVAIAQNGVSAQRAFLDGELILDGDVGLLLGHQKGLADLDDRLADLRDETEYE